MKKKSFYHNSEKSNKTNFFSLLTFLGLCLLGTNLFAQGKWAYQQPAIHGYSYSSDLSLLPTINKEGTKLAAGDNIGFLFSMAISLDGLNTAQVPPVSIYLEKGIKDFMTVGVYVGYSRWDISGLNLIGYGGRAIGYVFPIISKITGNEVAVKNLHPYAGITAGNIHWIYDDNIANNVLSNFSDFKIGAVAGARYNFLPGMGVMLEVGQNFMHTYSLTAGITFGK